MKKLLGCFLCVMLLVFGAQAQALMITPDDNILFGNETSQSEIDAAIAVAIGSAVELYKQDVGGGESGDLAGSYETAFFNSPSDPSEADITWVVSTPIVDSPAYLLVKDGNQEPAWYLFGLTALGWDGMEILELREFWPDQGAISHVSLYGTEGSVPEPATMLLLGSGFVCLAVFGRRRFKK